MSDVSTPRRTKGPVPTPLTIARLLAVAWAVAWVAHIIRGEDGDTALILFNVWIAAAFILQRGADAP
jgi:hypothetical protein